MLSILRHKGVSRKILWAVAIIDILSFGVFGTAYRLDNNINTAGKVYGKSVPLREFERAYLDSRDQAIISYGDRFFKMGQQLDLEREAWTRIILSREAQKRNITATDKEVVDYIAQLPFFQSAGKFDQSIYENIVQSQGIFDRKVKDFEAGARRSIIVRKLLDQVGGNITFTDAELKQEYIKRNEKIKLSYVLFTPADFSKDATITDDDVTKFFAQHKESFREPPMVNVQYVHILYPEKADAKQKQAIKDTAVAIAHELTPKADFAAIAAKHQQALKESGFFAQEQPLLTFAWSPEFVDKIFALKTGEVTSPMEAPDGWQIVKIKEKKASGIPEFASISAKVKDAALNDKGYAAAKAKAETTLNTIKEGLKTKDFKTIATELSLKLDETTSFARGEYINAPGIIAEFQQDSYSINDANKLSGVIETSQGPAIAYLSSKEAIDEKKFDMDKEDFKNMVSAQKRNEKIGAFITKLKFEANVQPDLKNKISYR